MDLLLRNLPLVPDRGLAYVSPLTAVGFGGPLPFLAPTCTVFALPFSPSPPTDRGDFIFNTFSNDLASISSFQRLCRVTLFGRFGLPSGPFQAL